MGEHIVHLARNGLAGQPLGLLGPERGLRFGPAGTLAQRDDELASGPYDHAPAQHQQNQQRPDNRGREERGCRVGAQIRLYGRDGQG